MLLVGPPGTGKTLLARAIAGEANVPFFTISGSDFVEMFVGVGASRVRDMFEQGKKNAPCIIFIDEIDAVGRHRGAGLGGGNDEREQTLNQLLVEMDGFEANEGVILIAATNRPDVLDPALLRPGRFDRQVVVPNPDVVGREKILKVHMRKVPLAPGRRCRGSSRAARPASPAPISPTWSTRRRCWRRAAASASVTMAEFEDAKDKVMMGAERRSMVMTEEEKKLTAYHEAGHALVHARCRRARSAAQGDDHPARPRARRHHVPARARPATASRKHRARRRCIASLFGGRVAEELIFGPDKVTTGAADDIRRRPSSARRMVTEFGFSDKLGPLRYSENEEEVFLGHSVTQRKNVSDATAKLIDEEIRRLVEEGEAGRAADPDRASRRSARARQGAARIRDAVGRRDPRACCAASRSAPAAATTSRRRTQPRSSVPTAAGPRARAGQPGGLEPEPQPGAEPTVTHGCGRGPRAAAARLTFDGRRGRPRLLRALLAALGAERAVAIASPWPPATARLHAVELVIAARRA